jgi:ribosomal protein S18 acetylase RimI-like enzyme
MRIDERMNVTSRMTIRRLATGDEALIATLATQRTLSDDEARALLEDEDTILVVAFDDAEPVGFVLAYVLRRRHGDARRVFVYEVEVAPAHRRRGVGSTLLRELEALAVANGIPRGFVLTDRDNVAAMGLYQSIGGRLESDDVLWEFDYRAR